MKAQMSDGRYFDERFNDALNNPVEIGKTYGYSHSSGGHITTVIGKAIRFTPKKVTLEVISRRHFIYGDEHVVDWYPGRAPEAKNVSMHGAHLFPVQI